MNAQMITSLTANELIQCMNEYEFNGNFIYHRKGGATIGARGGHASPHFSNFSV